MVGLSRSLQTNLTAANRTVIFQHIPKAAGITLNTILKRQYSPEEIYSVAGPTSVREAEFASLSIETRARFRLLKGHLYFGIHRHLPGPSTYVTMLRHPVDRVISHYHFVRRSPRHYLHGAVTSKDMTLEEYVSSGISLELNNGQVRSLFGPEHEEVEYGRCPRSMLEQARSHIRSHYSVVGTADLFDEAVLLMKCRLRWKSIPLYVPRNVSRNVPPRSSLSRSVIEIIERDNSLDIELYEDARRAFAEAFEQSNLSAELARFRLVNALYGRYRNLAGTT